VFTERGSATYVLKVYNPSDDNIMIGSVRLLDDSGFFRLNVDGVNGNVANDVPIYANDSIYVFCEVTIDPDQPLSVSPFIIQDRIEFSTNGNVQIVHLEAWGQNANYFPLRSNQKNVARLTCNNGEVVWDDEKPYVIYGVVFIDSCTLRIVEGRKIYVHGGIVNNDLGVYNDGILFTLPDGKLRIDGTKDNPVIIQDDRLEPQFEDAPGQWAAIRFGPTSRGHRINHTIIKNSIVGIQLDSLSEADLNSVEILNTAGSGVVSTHANLDMVNCLIHNTNGTSVSVRHGGFARIKYCTFSNYGNESPAVSINNFRCYDPLCSSSDVNTANVKITNTIMAGDDRDEIALIDGTSEGPVDFIYTIENSLYRATTILDDVPDFLDNCIDCIELNSNAALFVNRRQLDFHLDTLSQVEGLAMPIPIVTIDRDEQPRDLVNPDMGCYEFIGL